MWWQTRYLFYLKQWYSPGRLRMPLLTLHALLKRELPFRHQAAYAYIAAAGSSGLLAQQHSRYSHGNFTAEKPIALLPISSPGLH